MVVRVISRFFPRGTAAERAGRALILASFLSSLGFNFVFSLIPIYVRELSGPGATAALWSGLALAATPMAGAFVTPFWGRLADRFGHRPMLLRALASTTLIVGLMALPTAPWQLVVLRALAGALGSFQPMAMGALASWSRPEDLSKAISRLQMAQVFGSMVGPLAGGMVAAFFGIRFAPVAGAAALILGTILVARWFHMPARRRLAPRGGPEVRLSPAVLLLPILTLLAVSFTDASFNPILPLLLARSGIDTAQVAALSGLAASLSASAAAVGAGLAGRFFKHGVRYKPVMLAASVLTILAASALVAPLPWGVVVLRILCGGTVAGITVAAYSAGGLAVQPGQRGSAYGWLSSASQMGFATSPMVAGAMAAIDLRAVLALDAALSLMAVAGWGWSRGVSPAPVEETAVVRPALKEASGSAVIKPESLQEQTSD